MLSSFTFAIFCWLEEVTGSAHTEEEQMAQRILRTRITGSHLGICQSQLSPCQFGVLMGDKKLMMDGKSELDL